MDARLLPLLTAAAFAVGAGNAYRLPPRTMWGDVYAHVPNHLVTACVALLVAVAVGVVARRGTTARARRAGRRLAAAWGLVSVIFVADAVGGGIGDSSGDYTVHNAAMLLLPAVGLALLVTTTLVVLTRGAWAPVPLRLAVLTSPPGAMALNEASSVVALALGLAAAMAWASVAWASVAATGAGRPDRRRARSAFSSIRRVARRSSRWSSSGRPGAGAQARG